MPVIELDGALHEFPDDFTDAEIAAALESESSPRPPQEQGTTGIPETITGARTLPALGQYVARGAANHPAATQKIIGAGIRTMAGAAGASVGGVPGAVVGASIAGVTPRQDTIRRVAGRMAGETPQVADHAAKALGIQNYAKETGGLHVKPTDIINKPNAANAVEHYANAQEKGILRLYGGDGQVVSGPSAVPDAAPTAARGRLLTKGAGVAKRGLGAVGKGLAAISGPMAMTDLAQTIEPNRKDIGVMGIGASQPDPSGDELAQLNQRNMQGVEDRQAQQAQQWQALRAYIMAKLGRQ